MFVYEVYGLILGSEIACPELFESTEKPTVFLRKRPLNEFQYKYKDRILVEVLNEHLTLVHVRDNLMLLIEEDHTIWIDERTEAPDSIIRLNALGTSMVAILMKHGILPIHGNGIILGDKCTIFAGHSGRGKSTLAASFLEHGCTLISDDICAIKLDENGLPWVYPGVHHMKLKKDAAKQFEIDVENTELLCLKNEKYVIPIDRESCERIPRQVKAMYTLEFHDSEEFSTIPQSVVESIILLKEYTSRFYMLKRLGLEQLHFEFCTKMMKNMMVKKLRRPRDLAQLDPLVSQLMSGQLN